MRLTYRRTYYLLLVWILGGLAVMELLGFISPGTDGIVTHMFGWVAAGLISFAFLQSVFILLFKLGLPLLEKIHRTKGGILSREKP